MMTKRICLYALLVLFLGAWVGCGGCGDDADSSSSETGTTENNEGEPENLGDALQQAGDALQDAFGGEGGEGSVKESVDFRKLKDLLPAVLRGMERINAEGARNKVMGIEFSEANAEYRGEGGERMKIAVMDLGTMTGFARMGYAAWLNAEVDRESDRGFERTTKYKGFPALEKVERNGDRVSCDYSLWVGERFIVNVEGDNVDNEDRCTEARDEIDVRKLDGMKSEGT